MQAPGIPATEPERLRAVAATGVLDTPPEADFDAAGQLAAHISSAPIALVSLIDANRQWFKSCVGLDASEVPRELSFCGHVVTLDAPLVLPDTLEDPRFADHPMVTGGLEIRFYAGFPLRSRDNHVLGTLCVADTRPRSLDAGQLQALSLLATQVAAHLELRRTQREHQATTDQLRAALRDNQVLLQEVHHRVKNNLQVISSLIGMQLRQVEGEPAEHALATVHARVRAIAIAHERLYRDRDYACVLLADYVPALLADLMMAHHGRLHFDLEVADLEVGVDRAIPLGLLIGELVANAAQHAFPDGPPGRVGVRIEPYADGGVRVHVEDDGVGLPEGAERRDTLGLLIVRSLVSQLRGQLRAWSSGGAHFEILVPAKTG